MFLALRVATSLGRSSRILNVAKPSNQRLYFSCSSVKFDHYQTLGVKKDSSQDDIEKAFFKLAEDLQVNHNIIKMKKVMEAYETLTDEDAKIVYDAKEYVNEIISANEQSQTKTGEQVPPVMKESQMSTEDVRFWFASLALTSFLIITVPKIIYIIWTVYF